MEFAWLFLPDFVGKRSGVNEPTIMYIIYIY